jgi:hypothetical protein
MNQITEKMITRRVLEEEKKLQKIVENRQKELEQYFNSDFKLVGILNRFGIMPDFVVPIFVRLQDLAQPEPQKIYYFQLVNDETDTLHCISELSNYDKSYIKNVQLFDEKENRKDELLHNYSKPLYAFQVSKEDVLIGNYGELKELLEDYETDDILLKEEIQEFLDLESNNIWVRVRELLEKNFPNDSKKETESKIQTLKRVTNNCKTLEVYVKKFQDSVLRVGVRTKKSNEKFYFSTEIGKKLGDLLKD